jgi:DNA-binding MarR family transcriptional regulator
MASNESPKLHRGKRRRPASVDTAPLNRMLGFHLRVAMMTMRKSFLRSVADGVVHPGLSSLMLLIRVNPEASQAELANALHVNKATLVGLLNRAEAEGWLNRVQVERDRRRHVIRLTPEGEKTVNRLSRQMQRHEQQYLDLFSEDELRELIRYLNRIYDR